MGCGSSVQPGATEQDAKVSGSAPAPSAPAPFVPGDTEKLVELLGEKLLGKQGEVSTRDALAGKGAVMLYFSAHWCPPCRGFTPQLAGWYSKDLKAKGAEVIFVSSDRDEDSFKEYYGEMPWLALPYSERALKEKLSKKYKVQGIPNLVILDGSANVSTKDGRAAVSGDPTGAKLPWKPKSLTEIMAGLKLVGKDGSVRGPEAVKDKVFAFYFSAHWCPPCRGFTPQLAEWYSKDLQAKGLEVVFVSSDKDKASYDEYYKEMPWLALDFSQRDEKELLSSHFGVSGIPALVILDKDGSVISTEGRGAISGDPAGADFPWYPKPVGTVAQGISVVNELPTIIAFCEGDAEACKAAEAAMTPTALRFREEAKAAGEEDPPFAFLVCRENHDMSKRLRTITGQPEASPEPSPPKLMLFDVQDNGGFYEGPEGPVTTEAVEKLLADYQAKTVERKQLQM